MHGQNQPWICMHNRLNDMLQTTLCVGYVSSNRIRTLLYTAMKSTFMTPNCKCKHNNTVVNFITHITAVSTRNYVIWTYPQCLIFDTPLRLVLWYNMCFLDLSVPKQTRNNHWINKEAGCIYIYLYIYIYIWRSELCKKAHYKSNVSIQNEDVVGAAPTYIRDFTVRIKQPKTYFKWNIHAPIS